MINLIYIFKFYLCALLLTLCVFTHVNASTEISTDEIDSKITAVAQYAMSDPKKALATIKNIRLLHSNTLTPQQKVALLDAATFAYLYSNDFQKALVVINEIEYIADNTDDDYFRWSAVHSKATLYSHMDKGQEALTFYLEALKLLKNKLKPADFERNNKSNFNVIIAVTQNNIGYLSIQLGFYQEAIPFLEDSLAIQLKQKYQSYVYI